MGALDGRVAIITGAGRGLGREHALLFAAEGAKVVVNDLGGDTHGVGADRAPAQQVVDEIEAMGGEAVAHTESCSDFERRGRLVQLAVDTFGDLHVVVNNAGILRDKMLVNMTDAEWDAVINVHLRGHFCPDPPRRRVLARAGEGGEGREGRDRQHVVGRGAPRQRRPDELRRGQGRHRGDDDDRGDGALALRRARRTRSRRWRARGSRSRRRAWARWSRHPTTRRSSTRGTRPTCRRSSPISSTADCPFNGGVFHVGGDQVGLFVNWTLHDRITAGERWTVAGLADAAPKLLEGRPAVASEGASVPETLAGFTD